MVTSHAFRLTFALAVAVCLVDSVLPDEFVESAYFISVWLGYVLLAAFGFLAVREGRRYGHVFRFTWAFVGLWFVFGLIIGALGLGDVPAEDQRLAIYGYLLASAMFLPLAFASSGLGVMIARLSERIQHRRPSASSHQQEEIRSGRALQD